MWKTLQNNNKANNNYISVFKAYTINKNSTNVAEEVT